MNDEAPVAVPTALASLAERLNGTLSLPSDSRWDEARAAWQLGIDQRPVAVVEAAGVADVVATVVAARALGLRVAAQGTGHNAAPLGELSGTILLSTRRMRAVSVDPASRIARVDAGAVWGDVTPAAGEHGLAALAGSSRGVGIVGYCLGGGISWFARSHGLAASSVTAIELVTADGVFRRVDRSEHPELFWALRGGGGDFGVVTALEFRLYPIVEVHAGVLFFPLERAAEVLHAWRDWTETVPESVTTIGRVLRFPPMPDLPPFLSGHSFAVVEAVIHEDASAADALLVPLRALGPAMDTFRRTPVHELDQLHMDPPGPVPGCGQGALVEALTPAAVDAFLAVAGPSGALLLSAELRLLGGAVGRERAELAAGGALSGFAADALYFAVGVAPTPDARAAVNGALDELLGSLEPHLSPTMYPNFSERPALPQALFGVATDRLAQVKRAWDPENLIRSNHPVIG